MQRLLWRDNFHRYFDDKEKFMASRHVGYQQEVVRIKNLTLQARESDVCELVGYLRP